MNNEMISVLIELCKCKSIDEKTATNYLSSIEPFKLNDDRSTFF